MDKQRNYKHEGIKPRLQSKHRQYEGIALQSSVEQEGMGLILSLSLSFILSLDLIQGVLVIDILLWIPIHVNVLLFFWVLFTFFFFHHKSRLLWGEDSLNIFFNCFIQKYSIAAVISWETLFLISYLKDKFFSSICFPSLDHWRVVLYRTTEDISVALFS